MDSKEVTLAENIRENIPFVQGDENRLQQILYNLIGNAIKFRGSQPPRVSLRSEDRDEHWMLAIQDNGIGIDPADLERVFDVFRRLDPRGLGTGVGLAMARRIVEMHGGRIRAESEGRGSGSTFVVELPA